MQDKTKEKIQNIISRSFVSLPVSNDLPRLAKYIKVYDGDILLFPSKTENYENTVDYLHGLFMAGSHLACPGQQSEIESIFDQFFTRKKASDDTANIPKDPSSASAILSLSMKRFFESLGENHQLVKLFKPCNSATIAPAIIELKFALGAQNMTKDVADSWKFELIFNESEIFFKSFKSEQDLKNLFFYEWELQLKYNLDTLQCEDMSLHIIRLNFTENCSPELRAQIKQILDIYGPPPEISRCFFLKKKKS